MNAADCNRSTSEALTAPTRGLTVSDRRRNGVDDVPRDNRAQRHQRRNPVLRTPKEKDDEQNRGLCREHRHNPLEKNDAT
jgi:hypothetical protein